MYQFDTLDDQEDMQDAFRRETLRSVNECIVKRPRYINTVKTDETLRNIKESHAAKLTRNIDHFKTLAQSTRALLKRYMEKNVRLS